MSHHYPTHTTTWTERPSGLMGWRTLTTASRAHLFRQPGQRRPWSPSECPHRGSQPESFWGYATTPVPSMYDAVSTKRGDGGVGRKFSFTMTTFSMIHTFVASSARPLTLWVRRYCGLLCDATFPLANYPDLTERINPRHARPTQLCRGTLGQDGHESSTPETSSNRHAQLTQQPHPGDIHQACK